MSAQGGMRAQNILVTGGAGYIGSHTTKALAQRGFGPVVVDNLSMGHRWAVKWGRPLIVKDLCDRAAVEETFRTYDVRAVVHFAGSAYVRESFENPSKYFENNVVNTFNLLEAMRGAGVETIVFSSTCATYGIPSKLPLSESHSQRPISPYGESKLIVERMLHWYSKVYGFRCAVLRYFNAAGADPDGEIGEVHDPEPHLIPRVIQAARGELSAVEIYGTDHPTQDGTAVRDYIHVTDLAEAHVLVLEKLMASSPGQELCANLGTGEGRSVREVIQAVERTSGVGVPVVECQRQVGDPSALVADPSEAYRLLGWRPRLSDLGTIVQTAFDWHSRGVALRER